MLSKLRAAHGDDDQDRSGHGTSTSSSVSAATPGEVEEEEDEDDEEADSEITNMMNQSVLSFDERVIFPLCSCQPCMKFEAELYEQLERVAVDAVSNEALLAWKAWFEKRFQHMDVLVAVSTGKARAKKREQQQQAWKFLRFTVQTMIQLKLARPLEVVIECVVRQLIIAMHNLSVAPTTAQPARSSTRSTRSHAGAEETSVMLRVLVYVLSLWLAIFHYIRWDMVKLHIVCGHVMKQLEQLASTSSSSATSSVSSRLFGEWLLLFALVKGDAACDLTAVSFVHQIVIRLLAATEVPNDAEGQNDWKIARHPTLVPMAATSAPVTTSSTASHTGASAASSTTNAATSAATSIAAASATTITTDGWASVCCPSSMYVDAVVRSLPWVVLAQLTYGELRCSPGGVRLMFLWRIQMRALLRGPCSHPAAIQQMERMFQATYRAATQQKLNNTAAEDLVPDSSLAAYLVSRNLPAEATSSCSNDGCTSTNCACSYFALEGSGCKKVSS